MERVSRNAGTACVQVENGLRAAVVVDTEKSASTSMRGMPSSEGRMVSGDEGVGGR